MPIAIDKEYVIKSYTFTHAQVLAVLGASQGEVLRDVDLADGIVCTTEKGSPVTRRLYRISYPEARSLMGLVPNERLTGVDFSDTVTIHTERQTV